MRPTMTRRRELLLSEWEKELHEDTIFKLKCDGIKKEELSIQAAGGKCSQWKQQKVQNLQTWDNLKVQRSRRKARMEEDEVPEVASDKTGQAGTPFAEAHSQWLRTICKPRKGACI